MAAGGASTEIVGVYGRASVDKKELRISSSRQIDRGSDLAQRTWPGCQIVVYEDNNLSASNPDIDRPDYQRLLADIRQGRLTQIVAHEQSRLTRQPAQWDELVVALSRAGIDQVHTVLRGNVPVAEGNRLVGRIMAVVDADESERLRLRALAMHDHLAAGGRPNGGRYYGYRRQLGPDGRPQLVIYQPEAETVRLIADRFMAGHSGFQIAAELTDQGVPTGRTGRRWWPQAVLAIARRPHIAGLRTFRGEIVGEGQWEPILDRDRWELLQARINTDPHRGRAPRARRWLLTGGLAVCGVCGDPMITNKQPRANGNIDALICSPRARGDNACGKVSLSPVEIIEELVVDAALKVLESPRLAASLEAGDDGTRAAIADRLHAAEARVARAAELFGAGEVDEVTWRRMHAPAAKAVEAARAEMAVLAGPSVELPPAGRIRGEWEGLTLIQKRHALATVIEKVVVLPRTGRRPADHRERVLERLDIRWRI